MRGGKKKKKELAFAFVCLHHYRVFQLIRDNSVSKLLNLRSKQTDTYTKAEGKLGLEETDKNSHARRPDHQTPPFVCLLLRAHTSGKKRGGLMPRQKQSRQRMNPGQKLAERLEEKMKSGQKRDD